MRIGDLEIVKTPEQGGFDIRTISDGKTQVFLNDKGAIALRNWITENIEDVVEMVSDESPRRFVHKYSVVQLLKEEWKLVTEDDEVWCFDNKTMNKED